MRKLLALSLCLVLTFPTYAQRTSGSRPSGGSSSKPSFSGGSKPSPSKPSFSGGSKPSATPAKPKFSGGSKPEASKPKFSPGKSEKPLGSKPKGSSYDSKAGLAQKKAESKQQMEKAQQPKTEYKAGGQTIKIDPKDKKIDQLRNKLSREKYANRQLREQQFYSSYASRPVVVYHDPYSSLFWWYLLDRSLEERALWAYHHRADMDAARYQAMIAKDAQLEARVRQLEQEKIARDPGYTLKGMDPDLQYNDSYVQAAYNPTPTPRPVAATGSGCGTVVWYVFLIVLSFACAATLVWLVFIKRW